jgi:hypothetical protein
MTKSVPDDQKSDRIDLRISGDEKKLIEQKMRDSGIKTISAYLRKMALDGYTVRIDLQEIHRMVYLLSMCSNNLNQYARKANETGSIYEEDIQDLRKRLDGIYELCGQILDKLSLMN